MLQVHCDATMRCRFCPSSFRWVARNRHPYFSSRASALQAVAASRSQAYELRSVSECAPAMPIWSLVASRLCYSCYLKRSGWNPCQDRLWRVGHVPDLSALHACRAFRSLGSDTAFPLACLACIVRSFRCSFSRGIRTSLCHAHNLSRDPKVDSPCSCSLACRRCVGALRDAALARPFGPAPAEAWGRCTWHIRGKHDDLFAPVCP